MPRPLTSLKFSALALALVPLVAATQQAPVSAQQTASSQQPANSLPPASQGDKAAPGNNPGPVTPQKDKPAQKKDQPGQPAQAGNKSTPPGGTPVSHPNGTGVPVEVGDPWDSLKLDSKVRIKLSFRNANVDNVIAMLQQASHITIVKDPVLVGPITVTTADPVSLTEAFHVFNSVLRLKGFELSRDRKILVITHPKPPAPPPPPPMIQMAPPPDPNKTVVKFYPMMYANANQVARAINEVFQPAGAQPNPRQFGIVFGGQGGPQGQPGQGGPSVHASYEEFSNSVIVNAPEAQQKEVAELIKEIDKRQSEPHRTKSYKLVYATASEIVTSVQNVLSNNVTKGRGAKESNPFAEIFFGASSGNQNLAVADSRTNSIIVTGNDDLIAVADQLIADLDQRMPFTGTTFVFKLENARADTVANLMTASFGQRQGVQGNNNSNKPITPSNNTFNNTSTSSAGKLTPKLGQKKTDPNNLPVALQDPNADSGDLATSVGVAQGFFFSSDGGGGNNFGGSRRNNTGNSIGHDSDGRVIGVHDLTGQVTAIADPNTNSVIIVTAPDNVPLIKQVLEQLDKIPEQVMIQTIVVEATLDRSKQFGLEWNFAQAKAFGNKGTNGTATQGFGLQNATPALQGFNYALTGGDLSAFFNMLQTDTKFQVLATPRIFTSNNMESQINISQSIPYVTSTIQNTNGTFSYNYAFQDVGIVLTVTPHITSNGYVTMDVMQTANDLFGYTSFNAPIINQRQAETTISAKDGETIVLGGMIRSQVTSTVNKVPLLGDIPLLGNLFKSQSNDKQKTELLVFLTPRVVRDPAEAKKLKEEAQKALSPATQSVIKPEMLIQGGKKGGG